MGFFGRFSRPSKADSAAWKKRDSRRRFGLWKAWIFPGRRDVPRRVDAPERPCSSIHLKRQHISAWPHQEAPGIAGGHCEGLGAGTASRQTQRVLVLARRQIEHRAFRRLWTASAGRDLHGLI